MNRVTLTLESQETSATDLENILETLRPVIALITTATTLVNVEEED